jgi:hypothetical protein
MASTSKEVIRELELKIGVDANSFIRNFRDDIIETTPVRTGRAKSGWKQVDTYKPDGKTRTVIVNRVPYIGVLDQGASKQAPNGIVEPGFESAQSNRRK